MQQQDEQPVMMNQATHDVGASHHGNPNLPLAFSMGNCGPIHEGQQEEGSLQARQQEQDPVRGVIEGEGSGEDGIETDKAGEDTATFEVDCDDKQEETGGEESDHDRTDLQELLDGLEADLEGQSVQSPPEWMETIISEACNPEQLRIPAAVQGVRAGHLPEGWGPTLHGEEEPQQFLSAEAGGQAEQLQAGLQQLAVGPGGLPDNGLEYLLDELYDERDSDVLGERETEVC